MPRTRPPLERRVFREEIREKLIEDILSGRLAPGARIVETRIAQQFGVSQGPVREALRDLELFGFVVSSPFRGTQVRQISTDDLLEIYPIRAALEGVAARGRRARDRRRRRSRSSKSADRHDARRRRAQDDAHAQASADAGFHHIIIKAAGNRMLEHVWQTMRLSITTCVTHAMTHRSLHEITERHVRVLEALRSRDPRSRRGGDPPAHRRARRLDPRGGAPGAGAHASAGADTEAAGLNPKNRHAGLLHRRAVAARGRPTRLLLRQGILKLLAIKDSDVRLLSLEQCRDAVDKSLHAGGAFSATIPLVALYYGGFMDIDVVDPTRRGPGSVRAQQGARGGGAGVDLCRARLLRSLRAAQLAVVHEHPQRPSRPAAARRPRRDRSDGAGLRRGAGLRDRRARRRRASTRTA